MVNLLFSKVGLYAGITMLVAGGSSYLLYNWHYSVITSLEQQVNDSERQLRVTGELLNTCESNLSKQGLKGFIEGVGEHNETIVIDFSHITY